MRPLTAALMVLVAAPAAIAQAEPTEHSVYLHEFSGGLHLVPEQINARVGDVLRFTVTNQGASPHNFLVCGDGTSPLEKCDERWGFTAMIPPNGTAVTTVNVTKAGTFDYYCYVPGHKSGGMSGTLVVEGEKKQGVPALPVVLVLSAATASALWRARR